MRLESKFQSSLKNKIQTMMPDAVILKNDPTYKQGIPDLIILNHGRYAALECKRSENAPHQPNQDYYIDILGNGGYASFVYPENEVEVLNQLRSYFGKGD